jgi:hypothetical protein
MLVHNASLMSTGESDIVIFPEGRRTFKTFFKLLSGEKMQANYVNFYKNAGWINSYITP